QVPVRAIGSRLRRGRTGRAAEGPRRHGISPRRWAARLAKPRWPSTAEKAHRQARRPILVDRTWNPFLSRRDVRTYRRVSNSIGQSAAGMWRDEGGVNNSTLECRGRGTARLLEVAQTLMIAAL